MKALITGASSGIGKEIAIELSKKGYEIILVARDQEKLEQTQKEIKTKSEIICMDLAKEENCKLLKQQVGLVDILINNAGFGAFGEFQDIPLEKEIAMIQTNIIAMHILTKLYVKDMVKQNKGQILNVASIAGFMPGPLMATYYATKSYVVKLSEGIREELRRKQSKVKISILCPGPVRTNFNQVAGVKFSIASLSSNYVAKKAVKSMLKGKFYIIPGIHIKIIKLLSKITPSPVLAFFSYKAQKQKQ